MVDHKTEEEYIADLEEEVETTELDLAYKLPRYTEIHRRIQDSGITKSGRVRWTDIIRSGIATIEEAEYATEVETEIHLLMWANSRLIHIALQKLSTQFYCTVTPASLVFVNCKKCLRAEQIQPWQDSDMLQQAELWCNFHILFPEEECDDYIKRELP